MLTMRSSSVTKMAKPPPPVPPRPSKTIVAEALAKRRRNPEDANTIPARSAPPPPLELSKSQFHGNENFSLKKHPSYERTISDELKSNSRTIIFQSSNMRSVNNHVLVRKESMNREVTINNNLKANQSDSIPNNNKVISELESKKSDVVVTTKNIFNSRVKATNCIKITQSEDHNSHSNLPEPTRPFDEITINSKSIVTCAVAPEKTCTTAAGDLEEQNASPTSTLGNPTCDEDTTKCNNFDDKWEDMLKDKNHVNMLIDEMFASVLEVSKNEEMNKHALNTTSTTISTDNTTITISGCDNIHESSNVETNGSTVLIIEGTDKIETHSSDGNSLKKIEDFSDKSNSSTMEKKSVQFDDKKNAEFLIEELESMRMEQERILKRQRKPSQEIYDSVKRQQQCNIEEETRNCHINIVNLNASEKGAALDYERFKTMSLHGLPPLPKSLSGFNLNENYINPPTPARTTSMRSHQGLTSSLGSSPVMQPTHKGMNGHSELSPSYIQGRKSTNLDSQLAILRREMYSLRQLDLSLLSQLWSLNESIQDFRQILQDQEDCRVLSPPSPSPVPSSGDEADGEEQYYVNAPPTTPSMKFRPAPPPPPPARRSSNSSNASTGG